MECAEPALRLDVRATIIVDRSEYSSRQLFSSGGAGNYVVPNPIEVGDIIIEDGRKRADATLHCIKALLPSVYTLNDRMVDRIEQCIDRGNILVEIREADCRQPTIGNLRGHIVHIDANAADGEGFAFVIACRLD